MPTLSQAASEVSSSYHAKILSNNWKVNNFRNSATRIPALGDIVVIVVKTVFDSAVFLHKCPNVTCIWGDL